jgi:hypothetical protein
MPVDIFTPRTLQGEYLILNLCHDFGSFTTPTDFQDTGLAACTKTFDRTTAKVFLNSVGVFD